MTDTKGEYMELESERRTITAPDGSVGVTNVPNSVIEATMHDAGVDVVAGPCEWCARCAALQARLDVINSTLDNFATPDDAQDTPEYRAYLVDACLRESNEVIAQVTAERDALQAELEQMRRVSDAYLESAKAAQEQVNALCSRLDTLDALFPAVRLDDIEWGTPVEGRASNYINSTNATIKELRKRIEAMLAKLDTYRVSNPACELLCDGAYINNMLDAIRDAGKAVQP